MGFDDQDRTQAMKRCESEDIELGDSNTITIRRCLAELRRDDDRLRRLFDWEAMPFIMLVFFVLSVETQAFSYAIVFGYRDKVDLSGARHSWLYSTPYLPHALLQFPIAWLLAGQFPLDILATHFFAFFGLIFGLLSDAGTFGGIIFGRLALGFFEASITPTLFSITQMFWSREELPLRMGCWFSMGGMATIVLSLCTSLLAPTATKFLNPVTILNYCGFFFFLVYLWKIVISKGSPMQQKFLSDRDQTIASGLKRLVINSWHNREWRQEHVQETVRDPKTWFWFGLTFCASVPCSGITSLSPLLLKSWSTESPSSVLLNVPFGVIQIITIMCGSVVVTKRRVTGSTIIAICLISIAGFLSLAMASYSRNCAKQTLAGYYLTAAGHGVFPLIYSWSAGNTCGITKRKSTSAIMFTGQALGNVIGPLLFTPPSSYETLEIPSRSLWLSVAAYCSIIVLCMTTSAHVRGLNKDPARRPSAGGKNKEFALYDDDRLYLALDFELMQNPDWPGDGSDDRFPYIFRHQFYDDATDLEDEGFVFAL